MNLMVNFDKKYINICVFESPEGLCHRLVSLDSSFIARGVDSWSRPLPFRFCKRALGRAYLDS